MIIFCIIILVLCFYVLGKYIGIVGILGGLATVMFVVGLVIKDATFIAILGILFLLIWFIYMAYKSSGIKGTQQRTKEQMKEEENWGIVDFNKKK